MQTGAFAEPSEVTVKGYLVERWLPGRRTSLRQSTFESYRRNIETPRDSGHQDQGLVFARHEGTPIDPDLFSQTFNRLTAKSYERVHMPTVQALEDAGFTLLPSFGRPHFTLRLRDDSLDEAECLLRELGPAEKNPYNRAVPEPQGDAHP